MDATKVELTCPGCGKRYAWRPEYEGRVLTCKCGGKVGQAAGGGRVVTVGSGYVVGHRARPQVAEEVSGSVVREWVGPMVLLGVGVVGRGVELGVMRGAGGGGHGPGVGVTVGFVAGGMVMAAVAVVVGVVAAGQLMGSELDGPGGMARKAAGLAAFAAFVGVLCASFDKEPGQIRGVVVALHAVVLIYFVGITSLMRMDLLEALMATVVAMAVQVGLYLAVGQSVPAGVGRLLFYGR